jgi:predicted transcriptional regulator of viral defense system
VLESAQYARKRARAAHEGRTHAVAALFARQWAVAALWQLEPLGLTARAVQSRSERGTLYRLHRGVYALVPPHQLKPEGHWIAAVLACGPGAVLSHRSAASVHGLRASNRSRIDVAIPAGSGRGRRNKRIDTHSGTTLTAADRIERQGIPITSVARTILDLAAVTGSRSTELAIERATQLDKFDLRQLEDVMHRNPNHRGTGIVKQILTDLKPHSTATDSPLAERFHALIRSRGIKEPLTEQYLTLPTGDTFRVDFMWPDERVVVETDGRDTHLTPQAFQRDRTRDQLLSAHGWRPLRFTHPDVRDRSDHTVATVLALLNREEPRPQPAVPPAGVRRPRGALHGVHGADDDGGEPGAGDGGVEHLAA